MRRGSVKFIHFTGAHQSGWKLHYVWITVNCNMFV